MVTSRTHRMTELFGRLAPDASLETARAELTAIHEDIMREHPGAYSARADVQLRVTTLRDQIVAPAQTILLVLLGSAGIVFVIACSNVANLILARTVRREGELIVRGALGAGRGALRRRYWPRASYSAALEQCWVWRLHSHSWPSSRATPRASPSARST